jgi:hypothetical protein
MFAPWIGSQLNQHSCGLIQRVTTLKSEPAPQHPVNWLAHSLVLGIASAGNTVRVEVATHLSELRSTLRLRTVAFVQLWVRA